MHGLEPTPVPPQIQRSLLPPTRQTLRQQTQPAPPQSACRPRVWPRSWPLPRPDWPRHRRQRRVAPPSAPDLLRSNWGSQGHSSAPHRASSGRCPGRFGSAYRPLSRCSSPVCRRSQRLAMTWVLRAKRPLATALTLQWLAPAQRRAWPQAVQACAPRRGHCWAARCRLTGRATARPPAVSSPTAAAWIWKWAWWLTAAAVESNDARF